MSAFAYHLRPEDPALRRIGLIVLQVDETVEEDMRRLIPAHAARLHVTRIPSGAELTPASIARMEADLTQAAALLPDAPFDVIAYACTSGATLIGEQTVAAGIRAGRAAAHVTNPLTAALAAAGHLGAGSLAVVSPYVADVAAPLCRAFTAQGISVPVSVSFGEKIESRVARIDPASIRAAALAALEGVEADGIFLSCTNLRTLDILEALEAETGRPVLSSNQVLAWHIARLAGLPIPAGAPGSLFAARAPQGM